MAVVGTYSEVAICNLALAAIGRGAAITAMDENSTAARACALRYPYARDAVLRSFDWNFASKRAALPASATAPSFEFANAFDLPADCLQVRSVYQGDTINWVVEGRQILTDMGAPLYIKYTTRVTDPAQFDTLFVDCLAARIAAEIAVQLSESVTRADELRAVYREKLVEARRRDSQEGQPESWPQGDWYNSRQNGGKDFAYSDWSESW